MPPARHPKRPRPEAVVRPTRAGRQARQVWQPLFGIIEQRWRERFGHEQIEQLRHALWTVVRQLDLVLPDCLPILGYGLFSRESGPGDDRYLVQQSAHVEYTRAERVDGRAAQLPLSALLSKVLLAFTIEFERQSDLSLAICANILRVLDERGVRVRDLPSRSEVSKEAISMALAFLQQRRLTVVEAESPGSRAKVARLTLAGHQAQDTYRRILPAPPAFMFVCYKARTNKHAISPVPKRAVTEKERLFGFIPLRDEQR